MTEEEILRRKNEEQAEDQKRKRKLASVTEDMARDKYREFFAKDPFPNIQPALLNSADIYSYVEKTGMIHPFYPELLFGASYGVKVGEKIVWWDEDDEKRHDEDLSKPGTYFKLKPNSIAFVMLEPLFQIPDYIALRFNLKITHVYKGLLLGTGPIVDPGFVGKLSIPLHNLTANTYTIRHGDILIAMEFTKLSPNQVWLDADSDIEAGDELYKRNWIKENRSLDDYINRALEGNVMVRSSIPDNLKKVRDIAEKTQENYIETKKEVEKSIRNIQLVTILSIIPVLVFACTAIYQLGSANTVKKESIYQLETQCKELEAEKEELKNNIEELKSDIDVLEEQLKKLSEEEKNDQEN